MDSEAKTRPVLEMLWKRILEWRQEIHIKTRPDRERVGEALQLGVQSGLESDFVIFVIAICEWWFRVYGPLAVHIRNALRSRLKQEGYTPYGTVFVPPYQTPNIPSVVNRYVDSRLASLWNDQAPEQSRFLLMGRLEELVNDFTQPFRAAGGVSLPPKQGGYGWQAPWVVATVVYQVIRERYPERQNSRAIEAGLTLASGLFNRVVDPSHFHRKRRQVMKETPTIASYLTKRFENLIHGHRQTINDLLTPGYQIEIFSLHHLEEESEKRIV